MSEVLTEITPLSQKDFFYIVDRHKTIFDFPVHKHSEFELNFVQHASGARRIVGDSMETLGDYDMALIGSNLEHRWEQGSCQSPDIREITIQFQRSVFLDEIGNKLLFKNINDMFKRADHGLVFSDDTIMRSFSILDSLSAQSDKFEQLLNFLRLLNILSADTGARELCSVSFVKENVREEGKRIINVKEYIQEHFTEDLTLSSMAAIAGMSPTAFSRYFHLATGRTLKDYMIDTRLGNAARLLIDTSLNVSEICYKCGFNNLSNFNRLFKTRRGLTPKDFRAMYKHQRVLV